MELSDVFWEEYRSRFGQPVLPMDDLGMDRMVIRLKKNGESEDLTIEGSGYRWDAFSPTSGCAKIKLILEQLKQYGIEVSSVAQKW